MLEFEVFSTSVNAKQLAQPDFQSDPSRCKSGHGCHFVRVAQIDQSAALRRRRSPVQFLPWTPLLALVPQQLQGGFRKPAFVGASPTGGSRLRSTSFGSASHFIRVVM